jgi:hypothetical protein
MAKTFGQRMAKRTKFSPNEVSAASFFVRSTVYGIDMSSHLTVGHPYRRLPSIEIQDLDLKNSLKKLWSFIKDVSSLGLNKETL